jgi:hypothetical protein
MVLIGALAACAPAQSITFAPTSGMNLPDLPASFMNVNLPDEQQIAIRDAIAGLLSDGAFVEGISGYKMFDGDNLRATVFSTPFNIRDSAYDVDTLGCTFYAKEPRPADAPNYQKVWHCFYSDKISNVYVGSLAQTLRLGAAVAEQDALLIFEDALATCDLDFDVPYVQKPRLFADSRQGYFRFSAPRCHFEYRIRKGVAVRGKPLDADTVPGST